MTLDGYYFGVVTQVFTPKDSLNSSQYQYQYHVTVTVDGYAQLPCRCIMNDSYGNQDDFEDIILEVGAKVTVLFPRGDRSLGIIQSGVRSYPAKQNANLGKHWRNRYNGIVRYIDKDGNYSVTSDYGPSLKVTQNTIILDDSLGEKITLDKENKIITIDAKDFKIDVKNALNITVAGDVNLQCKNAEVTAMKDIKVNTTTGNISLNGDSGQVLTTTTLPIPCLIVGLPSKGVRNVKAGGPF